MSDTNENENEIQAPSLYERLGGEAAVNAAVDIFYDKVLSDYRINRFFERTDMAKQAEHLKAFMSVAFGGPNNYTGRSLRDGHARLVKMGLNDSHFDAVMEHLGATLQELNVPAELIGEAAALVESVRGDVLGK
jgi:hemoglobin